MPIKPENRARYPANWSTEIRPAILARAGNRCEQCNAPNGERICREASGATYMIDTGEVFDAGTGEALGQTHLVGYPFGRYVTVVLTIAHLDHQPEHCDPDNLRAWCQRCHLSFDRNHHAESRRATIAARRADGDLFIKEAPHGSVSYP